MAGTVTPRDATVTEFDAWLTKFNYSVEPADKPFLLALANTFVKTVDFCSGTAEDLIEGQLFLAYGMGNGFDPVSVTDGKDLVEKGIGRNAIVKRWEINAATAGTDAVPMLRRVPMAYNLLSPFICSASLVVADATGISNFEVVR